MKPKFWKISQSPEFFTDSEMLASVHEGLVYVHKDARPKGGSSRPQGLEFSEASVGEYFYLTHGNEGIYLLGQLSGPANLFSTKKEGWLDRPYRLIRMSQSREPYAGPQKWWAPNDNSTFTSVPENDLSVFEAEILRPYFGILLADFEYES